MQTHVLAHTLYIYNVRIAHKRNLIIRLYRDAILTLALLLLWHSLRRWCNMLLTQTLQLQKRTSLIYRTLKVIEAKRLEQIIDSIETETLDGILRVGGSKNHHRGILQATHKVNTTKVGHIDVNKHHIDALICEHLLCCVGATTQGNNLNVFDTLQIFANLTQRQRLIIYCYALYHKS